MGEGSPASARAKVQDPLEVGASVEASALDPLPVALEDAAADVGVERSQLDPEVFRSGARIDPTLIVDSTLINH